MTGAQAVQVPASSLPAASTQSSGSILVGLLTSPSSTSSVSAPSAAASSGSGVTFGQQTAVKPVFGQPASTTVFGGMGQPTSSSAPSFSFAPAGGAAVAAGTAAKPTFSFAAPKADGSQVAATAGKPQPAGAPVKTNLFGAFTAGQTPPSAGATPTPFNLAGGNSLVVCYWIRGGTSQATAGFQDSDIFQQ